MDLEQTSPSVFISYASADRERAFEICRYLEDMGHGCWIAPRNIRAGHDYGEEIIRGIERSRCFVLVFSSAANNSIYVKRELERAVSKAKPVFPVRLEDVLPAASLELHLASLQYLDAWNGALRDHIASLARALSEDGPPGPYPPPPKSPPPPWWRNRMVVPAAGAAIIALGVVAWWPQSPAPTATVQRDAVEAGLRAPESTPSTARGGVQGAGLSSCRMASGGIPVVRCTGAPLGSSVRVRSARGEDIVVPAGSGADSFTSGGIYSRSTYLPWVGPGATARVETAGGTVSDEVPLPGAPGVAVAVPVPSRDGQGPPLFYGRVGSEWAYAFFAPFDTMEVDWSIDGSAAVRRAKPAASSGPYTLASGSEDTKEVSIRWRNQTGEWSGPSDYRIDVPAARLASVEPMQDLVGSIACYRVSEEPMPLHLRCASTSPVPLGDLFEDLRWGSSANDLQPVDAFDFVAWANEHLVPRLEQPSAALAGDEAGCRGDTTCLNRVRSAAQNAVNATLRSRKALEHRIRFEAGFFRPWKEAESVVDGGVFAAMLPVDGDLYFEAVPRGGGERLAARIHVANHKP